MSLLGQILGRRDAFGEKTRKNSDVEIVAFEQGATQLCNFCQW
jgi:hypothetical protein